MREKIRIGCGAGFSGDRLEPALILAERGELDYLVLECLAERTIALAQKRKLQDATKGYDPLLERRIKLLLPVLQKRHLRLITNMGAANPIAAAQRIADLSKEMGIHVTIAAVTGDDVLNLIDLDEHTLEAQKPIKSFGNIISANAYLGIDAILPALQTRAEIIITGRVSDPSLFVAPMVHEFGWKEEDYNLLGKGTVTGHLLECAGQITGGYFAEPGKKEVPGMSSLGHPFADVYSNGTACIGKVDGTGGIINLQTAKEQLLYEVINPYQYYTPDVIADFTTVRLSQKSENVVSIIGGEGKTRPSTYKVSVGYQSHYLGEGEICYAGSNAAARAQLAGEIIKERLLRQVDDIKVDYIGINAVHYGNLNHPAPPYEVRLRVAAKASTPEIAALVGEEVEALYTNGPAGGGGVRKYVTEVIGIVSTLIDRKKVKPSITLLHS
jgi:hypothetical protein